MHSRWIVAFIAALQIFVIHTGAQNTGCIIMRDYKDLKQGYLHMSKIPVATPPVTSPVHGSPRQSGRRSRAVGGGIIIMTRKQKLERLRGIVKKKLKEKRKRNRMICPFPPPRYDEVWSEGVQWLEQLN